ncbi:unnamed protein product, partial [Symbiodinium microadriaticum]
AYQAWTNASPIEKLKIQPPHVSELETGNGVKALNRICKYSCYYNYKRRIDEVPQVEGIPSRASASSSEAVPDLKEVLADVGKMLKAMTTTTAMKKFNVVQEVETENVEEAVMVKAMNDFEDGEVEEISSGVTNQEPEPECEAGAVRGLLDSGASHALKEATQDEYDRGLPIKETLAGEDTKVLRQNICGTVLVAAYNGKKGALKLRHPTKGFIKVYLNNNCPEIDFREAHKLIKELENKHLAQLNAQVSSLTARLEVLRKEENRSWDELLREYVKTGSQSTMLRAIMKCPFTCGLPSEVQSMIGEGFELDSGEKYLKELPLTKRKRKALMNSNAWVVHMFAGGDGNPSDFVDVISKGGKIVLEVDSRTSKHWDIHGRSIGGHTRVDFHMGAFGHQAKRPTTAGTNYPDVTQLDGTYVVGSGYVPPSMLRRSELRRWPSDFKKVVADAILSLHGSSAVSDQELYDLDVKVSKLTKEQRTAWKNHLRNDHQPYRNDCSVCINAQATGHQHRRRRHPAMYTLAIDLAGPFKVKGRDMDFDDYKYIMVGAYRCPKNYLSAMELEPDLYRSR